MFGHCWILLLVLMAEDEAQTGATGDVIKMIALQLAEVKAMIGTSVTLSCTFNLTNNHIFFPSFLKGDKKTKVNGKLSDNCTAMKSGSILYSCNISVVIENIGLPDEDIYYCEADIPMYAHPVLVTSNGTKVTLHALPSSVKLRQNLPVVSGQRTSLLCSASDFYPQNISVVWFNRTQPVQDNTKIKTNISRSSDGTFTMHSAFSFTPTASDRSLQIHCGLSHPDWARPAQDSLHLSVGYAPSFVHVSQAPGGIVDVATGSTLSLSCTADGNPAARTRWRKGNESAIHKGETLTITDVQPQHGGLYWCVAQNQHGEMNTSVQVFVSTTGPNVTLYALSAVPLILLLVGIGIFWCRWRNDNSTGCHPQSRPEMTAEEQSNKSYITHSLEMQNIRTSPNVASQPESELLYADIRFPGHAKPTKRSPEQSDTQNTVYTAVGQRRLQPADRQTDNPATTVYVLATHSQA